MPMRKRGSRNQQRPGGEKNVWVKFGEYSQLAFILPSMIFAGWLIGGLLDRWFGTNFLYMVFLLLGIAGGLIKTIQFVQRDKP